MEIKWNKNKKYMTTCESIHNFPVRRLIMDLEQNYACSWFVPSFYKSVPHFGQSVPERLHSRL